MGCLIWLSSRNCKVQIDFHCFDIQNFDIRGFDIPSQAENISTELIQDPMIAWNWGFKQNINFNWVFNLVNFSSFSFFGFWEPSFFFSSLNLFLHFFGIQISSFRETALPPKLSPTHSCPKCWNIKIACFAKKFPRCKKLHLVIQLCLAQRKEFPPKKFPFWIFVGKMAHYFINLANTRVLVVVLPKKWFLTQSELIEYVLPQAGFEPMTSWLQGMCSAAVLQKDSIKHYQ